MDAVDARMCVQPHATSKIRNDQDLFRIRTLGFRGEALPSIVAVSNFRLKTSIDGTKGILYSLKGGTFVSEAVIACPRGTEISVRNLFFNTPARLQNLQSQTQELSHIAEYINKVALARPDIAFKLTNNDKLLLQTFGNDNLLEVISQVYDVDTAKHMLPFFETIGYFQVSGYTSDLNITRANKSQITLIVNDRVIKNTSLLNAIMAGYKEKLVIGRYPIVILKIIVDPALIDVNIHPSKLEVRFSNENELLNLVTHSIIYALHDSDMIVEVEEQKPIMKEEYQEKDYEVEGPPVFISNQFEDEELLPDLPPLDDEFEEDLSEPDYYRHEDLFKEEVKSVPLPSFDQQEYSFIEEEEEVSRPKLPNMYYIGQLHGTYLLFQDEDNFYMIDQHAAYERINYEKIRRELQKDKGVSYELLIPIKLNYSISESLLISEKMEDLRRIGIVIEDFGGGTYTVREIPIWIPKGVEREFVEEIIYAVIKKRNVNRYDFLDSLAKSLACKRSIKANQFLDRNVIEYLINDLSRCENPYNCPHGRPIIVKFKSAEIEKWFRRIV
jgi:DNA mismatch repair protein MutL